MEGGRPGAELSPWPSWGDLSQGGGRQEEFLQVGPSTPVQAQGDAGWK